MTAANALRVAVGHCTSAGRKATNQDFHGACIPREPLLGVKGIAFALADGISSSTVSHIASETAVAGFLEDYYSTPETWSVKKSAQQVLAATNAWLHAQTRQGPHRYDADRGYVCTMSVMVLKSATAHILHVGDTRIYRLREGVLQQLTDDHRVWVSRDRSHLGRALGFAPHLELDYHTQSLAPGDVFLLATDGVYEHVTAEAIVDVLTCAPDVTSAAPDGLDRAAQRLVTLAYEAGSDDNLTVQLVRVDAVPSRQPDEIAAYAGTLPCPPLQRDGAEFDGFRIVRELRASYRSHVYLAHDIDTDTPVVLKIPSLDQRHDPAYLERLLTEEWIARRIDSRHVVRAWPRVRERQFLYIASEYIDGITLTQWMQQHPAPALAQVLPIIEQIARGLQAFHRLEIVHQDLRPDNVLIDRKGVVKIIDLGSIQVAGIAELARDGERSDILGTAQYSAPEYFLGESGTSRSDIFSLGVMTYQMLSGRLPYGTGVARARSRAAQLKLAYVSVVGHDRDIPAWIDRVLSRALHPDPQARYQELSEFTYDLRHPDTLATRGDRLPLIERHPVAFWKGLCLILVIVIAVMAARQ